MGVCCFRKDQVGEGPREGIALDNWKVIVEF